LVEVVAADSRMQVVAAELVDKVVMVVVVVAG
jgi:hypothetical protein